MNCTNQLNNEISLCLALEKHLPATSVATFITKKYSFENTLGTFLQPL